MDVLMIDMPRKTARAEFLKYRAALGNEAGSDQDRAIMAGYKALAKGRRVLNLASVIQQGGIDSMGRPMLACARADATQIIFHYEGGWTACFEVRRPDNLRKNAKMTFGSSPWGRPATSWNRWNGPTAIVPLIPVHMRPKSNLHEYTILWEAEWKGPPEDPLLLRHLEGDLYVVVAEWNLTDLEQAVLGGRSRG